MGPTVWELDGPTPIENRSRAERYTPVLVAVGADVMRIRVAVGARNRAAVRRFVRGAGTGRRTGARRASFVRRHKGPVALATSGGRP
jgi:hypothetical protein